MWVELAVICFGIVSALLIAASPVISARVASDRRAKALLAEYGAVDEMAVYVNFDSARADRRRQAIDAKIAEMSPEGWTFLRLKQAPFRQTIRSWGGGLMIHFIRPKA